MNNEFGESLVIVLILSCAKMCHALPKNKILPFALKGVSSSYSSIVNDKGILALQKDIFKFLKSNFILSFSVSLLSELHEMKNHRYRIVIGCGGCRVSDTFQSKRNSTLQRANI